MNRPVRTRTPGGVGSGGENLPLTRLGVFALVARKRVSSSEIVR